MTRNAAVSLWVKSRLWSDIVEFYEALVKQHNWPFDPMLDLVRQITVSRYVLNPPITVLYPATSHDILLIAATEQFMWKTEVLEIRYITRTKSFQFDFWESPFINHHWSRTANASNSFDVFERFLQLKRWA
jgi:hypothetical protein